MDFTGNKNLPGVWHLLCHILLYMCKRFFTPEKWSDLFQSIACGEMNGKKDELEKYITFKSSKISYYILLLLMIVVLVVLEKVTEMNDIKNIPLVIVIGLAWITMPITEFVVSKKYQ